MRLGVVVDERDMVLAFFKTAYVVCVLLRVARTSATLALSFRS